MYVPLYCWGVFYSVDTTRCAYSFAVGYLGHFLVKLPWPLIWKFFCGHRFPFPLGKQLRVEFLGHVVVNFTTCHWTFLTVLPPFYIFTSNVWKLKLVHMLTNTCIILMLAFWVDMCLIVFQFAFCLWLMLLSICSQDSHSCMFFVKYLFKTCPSKN